MEKFIGEAPEEKSEKEKLVERLQHVESSLNKQGEDGRSVVRGMDRQVLERERERLQKELEKMNL